MDRSPAATLRQRFADIILSTRYADFSPAVVHAAKLCLLDLIGVALAGARQCVTATAHATLDPGGGPPEATLWGCDAKVAVPTAALLNAVSGHAIDMDDGHRFANGHPGVVTIPPAIALAEHLDLSGRDLLEAVVIGYEFFIRLGAALNPDLLTRGFHTTATVGAVASGAACAKLLRLSRSQTEQALALSALQSAGLLEVLTSGESGKSFQVGKAAQSGVLAARMAAAGADGPERVFEGDKGFFKAFSGKAVDPDALCGSFGRDYATPGVYFKRHAACRHIHSALDALAEIAAKTGLSADEVQRIDVDTYSIARNLTGHLAGADSELAAKFSTPLALALYLVFGRTDAAAFTRANLSDPRVRRIAERVTVRVDPDRDAMLPDKRSALVIVHAGSGVYRREVVYPKGEPEFPLSDREMQAKFEANATVVYSPEHARQLADTVLSIERRSVRDLSGAGHDTNQPAEPTMASGVRDTDVCAGGGPPPHDGRHHRARERRLGAAARVCTQALPRRQQPPHAQHAPGARDAAPALHRAVPGRGEVGQLPEGDRRDGELGARAHDGARLCAGHRRQGVRQPHRDALVGGDDAGLPQVGGRR